MTKAGVDPGFNNTQQVKRKKGEEGSILSSEQPL